MLSASNSSSNLSTPRSRLLELAASVASGQAEERAGFGLLEQYLHLLMLTEFLVSMTLAAPTSIGKGKGKGAAAAAAAAAASAAAAADRVERSRRCRRAGRRAA